MVLYRPNIWYLPPHIPYLLNYLLIWVKTVTYFNEAQALLRPNGQIFDPTDKCVSSLYNIYVKSTVFTRKSVGLPFCLPTFFEL